MSEKVIRPSHYGGPDAACDPLSVMEGMDVAGYASLAEAFAHANVLKLAWRVGKKAGEEESDREKLAFYALTLAFGRDAAEEAISHARAMGPLYRSGRATPTRLMIETDLPDFPVPATAIPVTAESPPSGWHVHEVSAEQTDAETVRVPVTAEPVSDPPSPEGLVEPPVPTTDDLSAISGAAEEAPAAPVKVPPPAIHIPPPAPAPQPAPKARRADPGDLLTAAQVAKQSGFTRDAIAWHVRVGNLVPTQRADNRDPLRRCNLYSPAEVARFLQARKEKARPPAPDGAAPTPKAVPEASAEPAPSSLPVVPLALPPRPEPEPPRGLSAAQAIALRQRERRESVRLDRALEAGRTQFHPAFVLCSREGDDGLEYRAFSNARAAETENVGWVVVCRYQKNGLGRWEEIGDGVGTPAAVSSYVARVIR